MFPQTAIRLELPIKRHQNKTDENVGDFVNRKVCFEEPSSLVGAALILLYSKFKN